MTSNHEKNANAFMADFDLSESIKTSPAHDLLPLFPIGRVAITSDVIDALDIWIESGLRSRADRF